MAAPVVAAATASAGTVTFMAGAGSTGANTAVVGPVAASVLIDGSRS